MEMLFAYGEDLDRAAFREACPGARLKAKAVLQGYRIDFPLRAEDGKGVRTGLLPDETAQVEGIVYTVDRQALQGLDAAKGVPDRYRRRRVNAFGLGGNVMRAWTYVAVPDPKGPFRASRNYVDALLAFAREQELSESGLRALETAFADKIKSDTRLMTSV